VIEGEGVNYERRSIRVSGVESGRHFSALTYLPIEQSWRAPTDQEYAEYILSGLAEWRAPCDYVAYVKTMIERALRKPNA
jgi:hypothetical protein